MDHNEEFRNTNALIEKIKKDFDIKYNNLLELKQKEIDKLKQKLLLMSSCSVEIVRKYLAYKKENESLKQSLIENDDITLLKKELMLERNKNIKLNKKITKLYNSQKKLTSENFKYKSKLYYSKHKSILLEEQLIEQELLHIYEKKLIENTKIIPADKITYIEHEKYAKLLKMYANVKSLYTKCLEDKRGIENRYINLSS